MRELPEIQVQMEECLNMAGRCIAIGCDCEGGLRALTMYCDLAWVLEWDARFTQKEIINCISHWNEKVREESRKNADAGGGN